jgi:pantetheine-phosphate adenylyltransferase
MAVYPGVFDPPTLAHLEIVDTALKLFDRLTVVVAFNPAKGGTMFTPEERVKMMEESIRPDIADRVWVTSHPGLIAPFAERIGACALVRGMRPVTDPDYEIALSLMNQKLAPSLPTVLLVATAAHVYLSSSFVRDTSQLEGLIVPGSVPEPVERRLRARFPERMSLPATHTPAQIPVAGMTEFAAQHHHHHSV